MDDETTGDPVDSGSSVDRFRSDCERCVGWCCVASEFVESADFAISKRAGAPCPHLNHACRCSIHDQLRDRGFPGCAVFECFGAGQQLTHGMDAGSSWREASPAAAKRLFEAFHALRGVQELLWHLQEAQRWCAARPALRVALEQAFAPLDRIARGTVADVLAFDLHDARRTVGLLLSTLSEQVREVGRFHSTNHRQADLMGRSLAGKDLRRANLAGALLIQANLSGANLQGADVRGADFRGTNVRGTNLEDCLFLSQPQLEAAVGDAATRIPAYRQRPRHWPPASSNANGVS